MSLGPGDAQLLVSQGGGGLADPLERDPDAVAADVAEGLVSFSAARVDYGVVLRPGPAGPDPDPDASAALRHSLRVERLGGRQPLPAQQTSPGGGTGRLFSHAFLLVDASAAGAPTRLACRRCGSVICDATADVYEHAVIRTVPAASRAPFGLTYPGSEEFVVRHCYCPYCARQFDVQIGRRHERPLQAAEPVITPPGAES
jgi:N-methylhydantoinase B